MDFLLWFGDFGRLVVVSDLLGLVSDDLVRWFAVFVAIVGGLFVFWI